MFKLCFEIFQPFSPSLLCPRQFSKTKQRKEENQIGKKKRNPTTTPATFLVLFPFSLLYLTELPVVSFKQARGERDLLFPAGPPPSTPSA
jgi:hypothetical protein